MFNYLFFILGLILLCLLNQAQAKQIALSFDDAPRAATGYLSGPERATKLLSALKDNDVEQTVFFAVSKNLDDEGRARLKRYSQAGHIIANHTHTHPDLNKVRLEEYIQNIEQADMALRPYLTFRKWLRFPYLREGDTDTKRDGVRDYLQQTGYFNAYITLNNYDWYIEKLFQDSITQGSKIDMPALQKLYVSTLIESIHYYDGMAREHIKRSPKHILLLHENDIAALFVGHLIKRLKSLGWEIIPIEEAYQDNISNFKIERTLKYNPGRIGEIAIQNGQTKGLWHNTLNEKYLKQTFDQEVLARAPE